MAATSFELADGERLSIGSDAGAVRVRAGACGEARVELRGRGLLPPPCVEVERDGGVVYLVTRRAPGLGWLPGWIWRGLRLEVWVPARCSLEVRARGGRVEVRGVEGEVEARSDAGPLVFHDVRGPIDARTGAGSIEVCGCAGDVELSTLRGAIEVRDVAGEVSAHTGGGRIAVCA